MLSILKVMFRPDAATCVFFGTIGVMALMMGLVRHSPSSPHLPVPATTAQTTLVVTQPMLLREGWETSVQPNSGS